MNVPSMGRRSAPAVRSAIVIGGGLVGSACALNLLFRGVSTTIVDPASVRRAASWGNAGHVAVEQVEPLASIASIRSVPRRLFWRGGAVALPPRDIAAWLPFSLRLVAASRPDRFAAGKAALGGALAKAMPAWRDLLAACDAAHLLLEQGHFVIWKSEQSAAAGRAAWARVAGPAARFREASPEELALLARLTARPPAAAIRFDGTGQIADPGLLAEALDGCFRDAGGRQTCAAVSRLQVEGGTASVELDTGEKLGAEAIVVAAGLGSAALLTPLGHKVPMIAERGYHIQSAETDWPADLPPTVFEDRSIIATRFRSGLRVAGFVEFARAETPPDPRKWQRLRDHAAALGLPLREPITKWMGARPTLPDYLPAIGRSRRAANLFYAFGHQHLGLTLAAVTGEAIAALVLGEEPPVDLSRFDLQRF